MDKVNYVDIIQKRKKMMNAMSLRRGSNRKLHLDDVKEIKRMLKENIEIKTIAEHFNVSIYTIKGIKSGKTWNEKFTSNSGYLI